MGKVTGFLEIDRQTAKYEPASDRIRHYREFTLPMSDDEVAKQAARCMDCGIPYCHGDTGCPVHNQIPDWNDLIYADDWEEAARNLHSTNNFPEFTGRICPAPCEEACTLNLEDMPVAIKTVEQAIADKAIASGFLAPQPAAKKTGKKVAVIGSGPAGLAAAQQFGRAGHDVHVFERESRAGGLLRYGIPDFKLEVDMIDRRLAQMQAEGVEFRPNNHVGSDISARRLLAEFDALVLAGGAEQPRDLNVPGRELRNIHYAMNFLTQQNRRVAGQKLVDEEILADGKDVVVIGGGDTGSDCVGTSIRQGARSVTQLEIMPKPPLHENKLLTWPNWPLKLRTSSSQEEGCERDWSIATQAFVGQDGQVSAIKLVRLEWRQVDGRQTMVEVPGSEFEIPAGLVLLAMGFVHPIHEGMLRELSVALDPRGNVRADTQGYQTSLNKVFSAGDMRRGQSLVVWAIREGRQCARAVDEYLMGKSDLPR